MKSKFFDPSKIDSLHHTSRGNHWLPDVVISLQISVVSQDHVQETQDGVGKVFKVRLQSGEPADQQPQSQHFGLGLVGHLVIRTPLWVSFSVLLLSLEEGRRGEEEEEEA